MPPRIVVLDGYTLTPAEPGKPCPEGEPSWEAVEALGDLTVYDRTPPEAVVTRAAGAGVVLTNKTVLDARTIAALPELKYIGVLATGVNVVDLDAAKKAGVIVTNVPGYSGAAVAQHVFALLLAMTNRVAEHDLMARANKPGGWASCKDFSFTLSPLIELAGKTLGIVGAGDIGQRVAKIGHALGMDILISSRTKKDIGVPAQWIAMDDLFTRSDVVTLHCPLTEQTKHLVNSQRLSKMKHTAWLINTARGPLIDEQALADALKQNRIAGAAVDVLSTEPPAADNPLLTAPNCIITPHNAWAAREARHRLMQIAAGNVKAFLEGGPVNVVGHG
ncbi:MAG: D-2-hydroxyacid dehydrogenase [Phycisphaerales bacterium]